MRIALGDFEMRNRALTPIFVSAVSLLGAYASPPANAPEARNGTEQLLLLNRVTWGANTASARALTQQGSARWLEAQLRPPGKDALAPEAGGQNDAMSALAR